MKDKRSDNGLDRREAVAALLTDRAGLLVVTGLGSSSYDVMAVGDHERNFYLWGAMGGAAATGLGLAIARKNERVLVITGDGEQLMGLGSVATIGGVRPENLTIAVLDNGRFGETGMQHSHTGLGFDMLAVAKAAQFAWCETVTAMEMMPAVRQRIHSAKGPGFVSIHIRALDVPRVLPPRDGVELKNRFRRQLGHPVI